MSEKLEQIMAEAIKNSVWQPASVKQEPITTLRYWRVFEVMFESGNTSTHFVGYTGREGRVTSPIERYFPTEHYGTSRSGRHYKLYGPSGWNQDAEWTWNQWVRMNKCTFKDITDQYSGAMNEPAQA